MPGKTLAPVVAEADSNVWLVTAIDLTNGPMLAQLSFRDDKVMRLLLSLSILSWLSGLRAEHLRAGWLADGLLEHVHRRRSASRRARRVSLHHAAISFVGKSGRRIRFPPIYGGFGLLAFEAQQPSMQLSLAVALP